MKAPSTPTRFHTPHRHYHRSRASQNEDWDSWIGDQTTPRKKKKFLSKVNLTLAAIATLVLAMGVVFFFGGL